MKLPKDKKAALSVIRQCNDAIETCLEQEEVSFLQETYDVRNGLIKEYLILYENSLTDVDIEFFKEIKAIDSNVVRILEQIKIKVAREHKASKNLKSRTDSYNFIAKNSSKK